MKFPWFRRQRKEPDPPAPIPAAQIVTPTEPAVDLTLARRIFYRTVDPDLSLPCPRCKTALVAERGVYYVSTRQGGRQGDDFILSGDFGFYCPACPTVVIDPEKLSNLLQAGNARWDVGDAYTVLGLVDMEAIPEDQRDVPFDELDAMPLVPFEPGDRPRRSPKQRQRKAKSKRRKKRR